LIPQCVEVVPFQQAPVVSRQPLQPLPWHWPSPLQVCPSRQLWQLAPLIPQLAVAEPSWQTPFTSQHPSQFEGPQGVPFPLHWPWAQVWPGRQDSQSVPWAPQFDGSVPTTQEPAAVQQPLQFEGRQVALPFPHDATADRTVPRTKPTVSHLNSFMDATRTAAGRHVRPFGTTFLHPVPGGLQIASYSQQP
jgi:hypothetical protein